MANRRRFNLFLTLAVTVGLIFSVAVVAHARTLTVPSTDYPTIKAALDAAEEGDTIRVLSTYDSTTVLQPGALTVGEFFPIEVLIDEITIKCEPGARIAVPHSRVGITVAADDVTIDGCLIESKSTNYDQLGDVGVVIDDANGVTLKNLTIRDLNAGIMLIDGADDNTIQGNTIYNIGQPIPPVIDPGLGGIGIYVENSDSNTFSNNKVYNAGVGLKMYKSKSNTFSGDKFGDPDPTYDEDGEDKDNDGNPADDEGNAFMGVYLEESDYNTFDDVDVSWNYGEGFVLVDSDNNTIKNSTITENGRAGVKLLGSDNNTIEGNTIENNGRIIGVIDHTGGTGDNKAVQIIIAPGESVEFRADFTPPETTGSGILKSIVQEKAEVIEKVDDLQKKLIELDKELLLILQKIESATGMVYQIKDGLLGGLQTNSAQIQQDAERLNKKLIKIEIEKLLFWWKKHGFPGKDWLRVELGDVEPEEGGLGPTEADVDAFPRLDEYTTTGWTKDGITYKWDTSDGTKFPEWEVTVDSDTVTAPVAVVDGYVNVEVTTQEKETVSLYINSQWFGTETTNTAANPPYKVTFTFDPFVWCSGVFGGENVYECDIEVKWDDITIQIITIWTDWPFFADIDSEKQEIIDEVKRIKQKVRKLHELGELTDFEKRELLQKLDAVLGILLDIDAELLDIDKKLVIADWLTPTPVEKDECINNPGDLNNDGKVDKHDTVECMSSWLDKHFDQIPPDIDDFQNDFLNIKEDDRDELKTTTANGEVVPLLVKSLIDAKLWVEDAMKEKDQICYVDQDTLYDLLQGEVELADLNCEGGKLPQIWEKLVKFDEELPPPPFELNGENLVAKMDDHSVDKEQICGNDEVVTINGRTYCESPETPGLVIDIAAALNADDEAYELAMQRWGEPWLPTDIYFERKSLGGSTGNQICSNVIRNFHNALADNIGIEIMPGSTDNVICNNIITNEELTGITRGETYMAPGKLTIGIKLVGDQNKIVYNAFEYLNIAIVRGLAGTETNEDVKHIQIFKKLALKRCTPVDPPGAPAIPECEKPKKVIVRELTEEYKTVSVSGKARFNRISLNLFEKTGIGIDVQDAESNVVDENLFIKNVSGAIVLDRLTSHNVLDIQIDLNDFFDGYSVVNKSDLPVDASNNYAYKSPVSGSVTEPAYQQTQGDPDSALYFCDTNFAYTNMAGKFADLAAKGIFVDGQLPPNTDKLPAGVILPVGKPRTCGDVPAPVGVPVGAAEHPAPVVGTNAPQDLDSDGLFEDVNANGRLDFDDAVQLALHIDLIAAEDVAYFDFNENGRLDFDDAVQLAFRVGGAAAAQALIEMFSTLSVESVTAAYDSASGTIRFVVEGTGIAELKVEVFNLAGASIYNSGFVAGHELVWNLLSDEGLPVANGVYLYVVTVRGYNGEVLRSQVKKLVVLR